jgi:hypothetical protein
MFQLTHYSPFALESFGASGRGQCEIEELDRHLAIEAAIDAFGQPDISHAAFTDAACSKHHKESESQSHRSVPR